MYVCEKKRCGLGLGGKERKGRERMEIVQEESKGKWKKWKLFKRKTTGKGARGKVKIQNGKGARGERLQEESK